MAGRLGVGVRGAPGIMIASHSALAADTAASGPGTSKSSFPQSSQAVSPGSAAFSVAGVNSGRPGAETLRLPEDGYQERPCSGPATQTKLLILFCGGTPSQIAVNALCAGRGPGRADLDSYRTASGESIRMY